MAEIGDRVRLLQSVPGTEVEGGQIGCIMDAYQDGGAEGKRVYEVEFHPPRVKDEVWLTLSPEQFEKL